MFGKEFPEIAVAILGGEQVSGTGRPLAPDTDKSHVWVAQVAARNATLMFAVTTERFLE